MKEIRFLWTIFGTFVRVAIGKIGTYHTDFVIEMHLQRARNVPKRQRKITLNLFNSAIIKHLSYAINQTQLKYGGIIFIVNAMPSLLYIHF